MYTYMLVQAEGSTLVSLEDLAKSGFRLRRGEKLLIGAENALTYEITTQDELEDFLEARSRASAWLPEREGKLDTEDTREYGKTAVNPSHYQGFFRSEKECLQWLETQQYIGRYVDNPEQFKAAVEMQVRKYLDRNGKKDEELQEAKKSLWYHKFLVAYIANGNKPIRVADINRILADV